ncbi:MAG TPA: alpha/beta fold hydrolase [Candidatus Dormibacteraeota bacterium]|jgi:pimeloyl-ACP methyl ester carboxylesterase|nr:alpha/beta fold hydrolase [Candidatus Dormibacteraeota bacterium]
MAEATFEERFVEADGVRVRYLEAGEGPPLVVLHGAGGLRLGGAHHLLAARRRVIAIEIPGFGAPLAAPPASMPELALTVAAAVDRLRLGRFDLMGHSFGGKLALWLAVERPEALQALVLVAPAAVRPPGRPPLPEDPEQLHRLLHAHPERQPMAPPPDPPLAARRRELVARLIGPPREPALEARLPALELPVLVLFGTEDRVVPPEMGRVYRSLIPNCHLVFVFDAGHLPDAERPEAVAALVDDFLERQQGFLVRRRSGLVHP